MKEEEDLFKNALEATVSGAIEGTGFKQLVQDFLGPIAEEAGIGLGYIGTALRIKLGLAVMKKAKKMLLDAGVDPAPVAPKLFFPILQQASLEDDEYLQSRWAGLLASAASGEQPAVHPSFAEVLKQLSPVDAKTVDEAIDSMVREFKAKADVGPDALANWISTHELASYRAFYGTDGGGSSSFESRVETLNDDDAGDAISILERLVRVGLVTQSDTGTSSTSDTLIDRRYRLTEFAFRFVNACRGPRKGTQDMGSRDPNITDLK